MKLTNENILVASLLGSKAVKSIPRFQAVENYLAKHVVPAIPFLPIRNEIGISESSFQHDGELWKNDDPNYDNQFFKFSLKKESETESQFYTLPWEPLISINARNIISKRYVAKAGTLMRGTIKERFGTDDFDITITGALYGKSMVGSYAESYPREDMERLREFLTSGERFKVECEPLQILGVNYIVIEEVNFPFTKGNDVQAYEIKAISDDDWTLLYQRENNAQ